MGEGVDLLLVVLMLVKPKLIGLKLVHLFMDKVKIIYEGLKTTKSYQKSYVDVRRRDL